MAMELDIEQQPTLAVSTTFATMDNQNILLLFDYIIYDQNYLEKTNH